MTSNRRNEDKGQIILNLFEVDQGKLQEGCNTGSWQDFGNLVFYLKWSGYWQNICQRTSELCAIDALNSNEFCSNIKYIF